MSATGAPLDAGCPSGLSPPSRDGLIDPSAFVREGREGKALTLAVRGARCGGCLSKIERAVSGLDGVRHARLNLTTGRLSVTWHGDLPAREIACTVSELGYGVAPFADDTADDAHKRAEKGLLVALGVAGFAMANIMLLSISVWAGHGEMGAATRQLLHAISGAIALPAVAFAGQPFFRSAWSVLRRGHANMDVPISLAVLLALGVSVWETATGGPHAYFEACVMLLFFLLIGRFLDARLRRRTHAAARDLAALRSRSVSRIAPDGSVSSVRADEIAAGDRILLAPGERAVVDFTLEGGPASLDESLVTGESAPRDVPEGTRVYAGSVNLGDPLTGRAAGAAEESLLADIERMLEAGEQRRSRYRRISDRAVSLYVPLVHTTAALTFVGWLMAGVGVREAILVAASTLIITCPCALALAAPVVQVVAAGRLFRNGVFLKSGDALERLAGVTHVVFDKTGTLTLGTPVLAGPPQDRRVLMDAAALARASRHPLSRALVEAAGPGRLADHVREHRGLGLEGEVAGIPCRLGAPHWVGLEDAAADGPAIWFQRSDEAPVIFRFEDRLQDDAPDVIAALRRRGLGIEILSGDGDDAVARVAGRLGVDHWTGRASPQAKTARLEALRASGQRVLMVGDGLNDAGALAMAHASLAPGGAMDVSQSASDAVYSGGGLAGIVTTIDTARQARTGMMQNFALAAGYNLIAVPIAVLGHATPLVAAIAMSASSLVVTLNALRRGLPAQGGEART